MENKPNHILVLLREVCDPQPPVRLSADGYSVRERGLRRIPNPADLCALEQALQLAKRLKGQVTVVSIGPQRVEEQLRSALSMGADRAIRVWESVFGEGDAVTASRVFGRIIEVLDPTFVMTGHRLLDQGADPVPALASAGLNIPYVTAALSVTCIDREVEVLRKCDRGARQLVATGTPCTLLFENGSCELRYPDHEALMKALEVDIESWGNAELGLAPGQIGSPGALLGKDRCSFPRPNPQRVVTPDAKLPAFERILALLSGGIKPREGKLHQLSAENTVERLMEIFASEGLLGGE